jgi:hypothetical protein
MDKPFKKEEIPPDAAPGEYGPITWSEFQALPEDVRKRRAQRVYEKTMAVREWLKRSREVDETSGGSR